MELMAFDTDEEIKNNDWIDTDYLKLMMLMARSDNCNSAPKNYQKLKI